MKNSIGKKILVIIFIPFLIIFLSLSLYITGTLKEYFTDWTELEIKGIAEINVTQLEGMMNSVRISVQSVAEVLENIDSRAFDARLQAWKSVCTMFANESVYNAWLAYEPNAFDGRDKIFSLHYPGSPSGRFILSYVKEDGQILVAPDMDDITLDDPEISPWYTVPRDENRLYIDVNNEIPNLYDYGLGSDPIYTLSVVMPIRRNGQAIGCVGADMMFDDMTFGIDNAENAAVAIFYPNGRLFYASDLSLAEESLATLGFQHLEQIAEAMAANQPLFLPNEYSAFLGEQAFSYFHPIHSEGMGDESLFLYVAVPQRAVIREMTPVVLLVAGISLAVLITLFVILIYVVGKVSRPIRELTLSADAISQGRLETEIAFFSDSQGEIGLLSNSLHRMVEQFRDYINKQERVKEEAVLSNLLQRANGEKDFAAALQEITVSLCRHYNVCKASMVLLGSGKASVVASWESGLDKGEKHSKKDFLPHSQVAALLPPGRKILFLNAFAIASHKISFAGQHQASMCLVPIWGEPNLQGYLLLESNNRNRCVSSDTEYSLIYLGGLLSVWVSQRLSQEGAAQDLTSPPPQSRVAPEEAFISKARQIGELSVEAALEMMGGLKEMYEKSLRLLARTLPPTMAKLDDYLRQGDIKAFAIEIHGLKGALGNIGAVELSARAAQLESLAKEGDMEGSRQGYGVYSGALTRFAAALAALAQEEGPPTTLMNGDMAALKAALPAAREACQNLDSLQAQDILAPLIGQSFGSRQDKLLAQAIRALESFDCDQAEEFLGQLGQELA